MATTLNVTPVGNNLFQVEIHDEERDKTIEVGVPDGFVEELDPDAALQDVVRESVRFALEHGDPDDLDGRVSLDELAERHPGLTASVAGTARPAGGGTPTDLHVDERDQRDQDQRLVDETIEAQEEGRASRQPDRF